MGANPANVMNPIRICNRCGTPVPASAPQNLCLRCLFDTALDLEADTVGAQIPAGSTCGVALRNAPPPSFGDYELLSEIGRGGQGTVYRARHRGLGRVVALKTVAPAYLANAHSWERFRLEAVAASSLDHPNIIPIYEVGERDSFCFYSMKLVEGSTLEQLVGGARPFPGAATSAREQGPSLSGTHSESEAAAPEQGRAPVLPDADMCRHLAAILVKVARAVHHAHQRGVLHRDLKPSNILLDQEHEPHVSDFGLARQITEDSSLTATQTLAGTPAYLAPEVATGGTRQATVAADIYGLGAILYHALTGRPPFSGETVAATLRAVQETEPALPRHFNPSAPRDLETICLKCLEKELAKRYASAQEVAQELERFLRDEPILARPVSRVEKAWRWCRRKPALTTSLLVILVLLLAVTIGSPIAVYRINQARRRAQAGEQQASTAAAKSQQVSQLLKEMLEGVGPSKALGRDTTMLKEILDKTAERLSTELTNQPEVELELRATLATTYEELGLFEQMERMARQSLALARARLGEENTFVAEALAQLGDAQFRRANYEQAADAHRQALALRRKLFGDQHLEVADSLGCLALTLLYSGKPTEAASMQQEAVAMMRKLPGNHDTYLARALSALAENLKQLGRLAEAEAADLEAVALLRKLPGNQPDLATALNNLANVLVEVGKPAEAVKADREALDLRRKLGQEGPDFAASLTALARDLLGRGEYAEAERLAREGLAMQKKFLGDENDLIADTLVLLGNLLRSQGKLGEAESTFREALALGRKVLGNKNQMIPIYLNELGVVLLREEKLAEAEDIFRESLELYKKFLPSEHSYIASSLGNLALVAQARGDLAGAETLSREALAMFRKLLGNENPRIAFVLDNLARTLRDEGKLAGAEDAACEALTIRQKARLGADHPNVLRAIGTLASVLGREGRLAEAEALYQAEVAGMLARLPADDLQTASALADLSSTLLAEGRFADAEPPARLAVAIREEKLPEDWATFNARSILGGTLLGQNKYVEAEPLLLSGYNGMKQREDKIPAEGKLRLKDAIQRLAQLYDATGRSDQSAEWKKKLAEFDKAASEQPGLGPKP